MLKKTSVLVLLILIVPYSKLFSQPSVEETLVRIYSENNSREGQGLGTGFFITPDGYILTAYHVIQGAETVKIFSSKGRLSNVELIAYDNEWDLALLKVRRVNNNSFPNLEIQRVPDNLLNYIGYAWGHPNGKANFRVELGFTKNSTIKSDEFFGDGGLPIFKAEEIDLISIDATINKGMSGGPVLINGKVIGVISGGQSRLGGRNFGWAIPATRIHSIGFLDSPTSNFKELPALTMLRGEMKSPLLRVGLHAEKVVKLDLYKKIRQAIIDSSSTYLQTIEMNLRRLNELNDKLDDINQQVKNGELSRTEVSHQVTSAFNSFSKSEYNVRIHTQIKVLDFVTEIDTVTLSILKDASIETDDLTEDQLMRYMFSTISDNKREEAVLLKKDLLLNTQEYETHWLTYVNDINSNSSMSSTEIITGALKSVEYLKKGDQILKHFFLTKLEILDIDVNYYERLINIKSYDFVLTDSN